MMATLPFLVILVFAIFTDAIQSDWPHFVFRAAACLLCSAYLLLSLRKPSLRLSWILLPLGLLVGFGLVQLTLDSTVWRFATWRSTLQWTGYLALFLAALQCNALRSNLRLFVWFGGLFSLYALILFANSSVSGDRGSGTFLNQNHYAALMELLLPIAMWRFFRDREKSVYALCALLIIVSVAAGGSRTGLLLLFGELIYLGLRESRKPLLVVAGASLIAALGVGFMWTRFQALATSEPYESRSATARATVKMIQSRPLIGYGLGSWPSVYPAFAERDTGFRLIHADNDWLEWTAEGGILFAITLAFLAALIVRAVWKEPWCAGCIAVMLHSLVEFPLQKQAIWACLLVLLAAAQPFSARRKHSS